MTSQASQFWLASRVSCALLLVALAPSCADGDDLAADARAAEFDGGAGQADAMPSASVPVQAGPLFAFLQSGDYESFLAEPEAHASTGPHGRVRTFFNSSLATSLGDGSTEHPVGAATIKELFSGESLTGWAVMVKTEAGAAADSWYFYEIFSTTDGSSPVADGNGVSLCSGCHSGGSDFVLSGLPE